MAPVMMAVSWPLATAGSATGGRLGASPGLLLLLLLAGGCSSPDCFCSPSPPSARHRKAPRPACACCRCCWRTMRHAPAGCSLTMGVNVLRLQMKGEDTRRVAPAAGESSAMVGMSRERGSK